MSALSPAQRRQFQAKGFVVIKGCFSRETARAWTDKALRRLGCDPADPKTWTQKSVTAPRSAELEIRTFAPKAWAAICELVGGEDRVERPELESWLDAFHVKFPHGTDRGWIAPSSPENTGWHKDGGPDEPHFLDDRRNGLQTFAHFSTVKPKGGGTFLAVDSVPLVARWLAAHPQGARITDASFHRLVPACRKFEELTAEAGDVALVHPYMIHTESFNCFGEPRFLAIRMIKLAEKMRFDRERARDHSLVEAVVVKALR